MSCTRIRSVLDAYLDGELDIMHAAEIDRHVDECPTCRDHWQQAHMLRAAVQENAPYYRAPAALRAKLSHAQDENLRRHSTRAPWRWPALAASILLGAIFAGGGTYWMAQPSPNQRIVDEVVSGHVRSLMVAARTTDISSSDLHTVKPWFNGKLDFAPSVVDLTTDGFPLIGGRLDYLARRPVAALVYRHRQHIINVFAWPTDTGDKAAQRIDRHGYHVVHWRQSGMDYWAVSDLNAESMKQFGETLRARLQSQPHGHTG